MPKAHGIATELRKLADSLDKEPEAELAKPTIYFSSWHDKTVFLNAARILPRPLKKSVETESSFPALRLDYETPWLDIRASIQQSAMCELIEPAKPAVFKCHPILSEEEDAALVGEP